MSIGDEKRLKNGRILTEIDATSGGAVVYTDSGRTPNSGAPEKRRMRRDVWDALPDYAPGKRLNIPYDRLVEAVEELKKINTELTARLGAQGGRAEVEKKKDEIEGRQKAAQQVPKPFYASPSLASDQEGVLADDFKGGFERTLNGYMSVEQYRYLRDIFYNDTPAYTPGSLFKTQGSSETTKLGKSISEKRAEAGSSDKKKKYDNPFAALMAAVR